MPTLAQSKVDRSVVWPSPARITAIDTMASNLGVGQTPNGVEKRFAAESELLLLTVCEVVVTFHRDVVHRAVGIPAMSIGDSTDPVTVNGRRGLKPSLYVQPTAGLFSLFVIPAYAVIPTRVGGPYRNEISDGGCAASSGFFDASGVGFPTAHGPPG